MVLENADVVSLNEESTIPQLLGSPSFYILKECKKFCIKLSNLWNTWNSKIEIELNKIDKWDEYKDEILKTIQDKMPNSNSPFY